MSLRVDRLPPSSSLFLHVANKDDYWPLFFAGEMVISSEKFDVQDIVQSMFELKMVLTVKGLHKGDIGSYKCISKNSLGEVESNIRIYGKVEFITT